MRSLVSILLLILLMLSIAFAQPDTLWTKTYGGINQCDGYSVQQTSDNGYIIVGKMEIYGTENSDVYLIKTDSLGIMQWNHGFGGSRYDEGKSVQQTSDGGYIIAGSTESFGAGLSDVCLIKTDPSGVVIWSQTYGGLCDDWGECVDQTNDGGYIIAGTTESAGAGMSDAYLVKTDSLGVEEWSQTFGTWSTESSCWVQQTLDGGYILVTEYRRLVKTDTFGNLEWTFRFDCVLKCAEQTSDGGYILIGVYMSNSTYLLKVSESGTLQWRQEFPGSYSDGRIGESVRQTNDGGYIVGGSLSCGYWDEQIWVLKTDSLGNNQWEYIFDNLAIPGSCKCWSIQQTSDGGYIIAGSYHYSPFDITNVLLVRLATEPNPENKINQFNLLDDTNFEPPSPNPFNPITTISYDLPKGGDVSLLVYDILGQEVVTLIDGYKSAGTHQIVFNAKDLTSGVYFARLTVDGGGSMVRKLVLMK